MTNESYKLTYFNLKAVGEPIRLIFAYAGVKYEDNRIEHADWPDHKKSKFSHRRKTFKKL